MVRKLPPQLHNVTELPSSHARFKMQVDDCIRSLERVFAQRESDYGPWVLRAAFVQIIGETLHAIRLREGRWRAWKIVFKISRIMRHR